LLKPNGGIRSLIQTRCLLTLSLESLPPRSHRGATSDKDYEKADSEDGFDLGEYLRSNQAASDEAGIKHKRLGVVWENVSVIANSGISLNIRTFQDTLLQFFLWAPIQIAMKCGAFDMGKKELLANFSGE